LKKDISSYKKQQEAAEVKLIHLEEAQAKISNWQIVYKKLVEEEKTLTTQLATLERELPQKRTILDELKEKEQTLETRYQEKRNSLEQQQKELEKEAKDINGQLKNLSDIEKQLTDVSLSLQKEHHVYQDWEEGKKIYNRMDEQAKVLKGAQESYAREQALMQEKKDVYEQLEEKYRNAAVGLVAATLKEGEPCPVCGSKEHPKVAVMPEGAPSEDDVKKAKKAYESQNKIYNQTYRQAASEKAKLEQLQENLEDWKKRSENAEIDVSISFIEQQMSESVERGRVIRKEKDELEKQVQYKKSLQKKSEQLAKSEKDCFSSIDHLMNEKQEEAKQLKDQIQKAENDVTVLQTQMKGKEEELVAKQAEQKASIAKRNKMFAVESEEAFETLLGNISGEKSVYDEKKEMCIRRLDRNQNAELSLKEHQKNFAKLDEKYGVLKGLDDVTKGKNKERIVFEQYVLGAYFEDILDAANKRLAPMSGGRYRLQKVKRVTDARTKDSLELEVLDELTGKVRAITSLSGGEAFKAALSLALGMSDIIQEYSGGVQIDTMFIDEGFGHLDEDSLNQAMDTLEALAKENQLIGIISHVGALKERIDRQIVVNRGKNGSEITTTGF
ncbi:MAG: SMC family ATPase, partial [Lachnospiraceae bacterium]|nr:SMC family ATPase [Lachnospiraceae bacterium]